jgi:chromosome segregation ATPase
MIEPIMFVGIGFLVAGLLVIGVIPLVHARAVRLTQRRLEAITPMSMGEIRADKDQLRAEFAMSTRRLEMSVEQMKEKTTSQLADLGKKSEAISRLKYELGEKTAALNSVEARENVFREQLQNAEAGRAVKAAALEEAERKLAAASAEIAKYTSHLHNTSLMADSQRVELLALRAQTEVLNGQIESYERETKELHDRLARDSAAAETASRKLAEERTKTGILGDRVGELERQLVAQSTEAGTLKEQVQQLINERTKLLREMETIKREWAATSEAERTENAVMREQISDVAAEVARLTSALEGPTSPIEAILADEVDCLPAPSNGSRNGEQLLTGIPEAAESSKGTLADRIRRLQSRTARVPQPSSA